MASRIEQAIAMRDADALRKALEKSKSADQDISWEFFQAVNASQVESLEFLLDALHPPIDATWMHIVTDVEVLRLLVAHGGDINAIPEENINRSTPLHTAAEMGRLGIVSALVELGASTSVRDVYGRTPLIVAAVEMARDGVDQGMETISLLIELGADPSLTDYYGNTATASYRFACRFDWEDLDEEAVRRLVEIGSPDDMPTVELFISIFDGDLEGVRNAIASGADIHRISPPPGESTPLECAAAGGSTEMVQILLDAGADPNKPGLSATPLIKAARSGHLPVLKQLISAGADIEALQPEQTCDDERVRVNAYLAAEIAREHEVMDYLKSLSSGMPKPKDWKPIEPGVGSWNDFSELLVKADAATTAQALAKMIGGKVEANAYGKSFTPGNRAYVVARPKGLLWTNVFRVAPPVLRWPDAGETARFAQELAQSVGTSVLTIEYSDTSDAAAVGRYEPCGGGIIDDGWDDDTLQEMADAMEELGDEIPDWAQKRLSAANPDEPGPSSNNRLVTLAAQERFAVARFAAYCEPGRQCDVQFSGYPSEAFDGVAWVSD